MEAHYFPLSVALLQRPLQSYILAISLTQKQLRYLHHEQCIHSIPFTRIIRISPYSPVTTPSPSHHSQHSASSLDAVDLSSSPSLSLTLHVVGNRIGDTDHIHHHTHCTQMRDGLLTFLLATVTPDNPPLLPSFYPLTLTPLHGSIATKRGKWGTDAQRWMALLDGGRLLLFRREPTSTADGSGGANEPLTCIMLTEVGGIEKKGGRKLRLRGSEREWELGLDGEAERDEWWRLLIKQREAIVRRADEWQHEWRTKRAEEDARREKQLQEEMARLQLQEDEHKSNTASPTPATPITPHSLLRPAEKPKRKTMPSPAFFVNASVIAARNKRGSLSIKTRAHPQQGQAGSGGTSTGMRSTSSSEREESKTAGFSMESSGHISPAISPWSAVTPRLNAQLPPSASMLRAATAASLTQPPLSFSNSSRLGLNGGSPSPPMAFSSGSTLPPSPLLSDEKQRSGHIGVSVSAGSGGVRALQDESGMRRSSMTTW